MLAASCSRPGGNTSLQFCVTDSSSKPRSRVLRKRTRSSDKATREGAKAVLFYAQQGASNDKKPQL